MRTVVLTWVLLFVAAFSLATFVEPRHDVMARTDQGTPSALTAALGDGKRLFANDVFARADAYFHRGVLYYSVLQTGQALREDALADFRRYLALAPDGEYAAQARDYAGRIEAELAALNE